MSGARLNNKRKLTGAGRLQLLEDGMSEGYLLKVPPILFAVWTVISPRSVLHKQPQPRELLFPDALSTVLLT